jgi:hypothetical protein
VLSRRALVVDYFRKNLNRKDHAGDCQKILQARAQTARRISEVLFGLIVVLTFASSIMLLFTWQKTQLMIERIAITIRAQ